MAAISIEEALKRFDRRFYSYHVNQDKLRIFSENVKHYVDMTIKAIHENESEEHLKNITNSFLKTVSAFSNYNGGDIFFGIDDDGNVKGDAVQYVLETVYKTADTYAQSVEECSEMVSEPVDGCFYILSYVYHNSIAF